MDAAEKFDFEYVIGGHGEVMHGKQKFELWKQYFRDLLERTTAAYVEGATMEEAKKRVSEFLTAKYADKLAHFPQNVAGDVAKAYQGSPANTQWRSQCPIDSLQWMEKSTQLATMPQVTAFSFLRHAPEFSYGMIAKPIRP